jgi:hypothetical protein
MCYDARNSRLQPVSGSGASSAPRSLLQFCNFDLENVQMLEHFSSSFCFELSNHLRYGTDWRDYFVSMLI